MRININQDFGFKKSKFLKRTVDIEKNRSSNIDGMKFN
jgi:hypothetical protein